MEKIPRHTPGRAREEADEITNKLEKIAPEQRGPFSHDQYARIHEVVDVESKSIPANQEKVEFILTPELKEAIMAKVEDVNAYGTAYTWIMDAGRPGVKENIFTKGILGIPRERRTDRFEKEGSRTPEGVEAAFKEGMESGEQTTVSFNIVGRSFHPETIQKAAWGHRMMGKYTPPRGRAVYETGRGKSEKERISKMWSSGYGVIFDLTEFKEGPTQLDSDSEANWTPEEYTKQRELGTYNIRSERELVDPSPNERGDLVTSSEYGFSMYSRIEPDKFKAIIIDASDEEGEKKQIAETLSIWTRNPEVAMPIYDRMGDLIWPERISNEEIKNKLKIKEQKGQDE